MDRLLLLLCLLLSACSAWQGQHERAGGTQLIMDASGHVIAVPMKASTPAPVPATTTAAAPTASTAIPSTLKRQGNYAVNLMDEPYTPVEDIDQGRAGKKHFFVLPAGVNGEVASTDLSTHGAPKDAPDRLQPLLGGRDPAWQPWSAPAALALPDPAAWALALAQLKTKDFSRAESGLEIHWRQTDVLNLQVAQRSYRALAAVLRLGKKPPTHAIDLTIFEYESVRCGDCIFMPVLVALDDKNHLLALDQRVFDRHRKSDRWTYAGWRGHLQVPASTRRLLIVDGRPAASVHSAHLPTFALEYAP